MTVRLLIADDHAVVREGLRLILTAQRDFEVVGADGSPVALATTSWAVLDLSTKKPVAVEDLLKSL